MATSSERMAAGVGLGAFAKAEELKKRIWFTLGALIIYRLGTYLPLPGIDPGALSDIFSQQSSGILGMFDMFSGGALGRIAGEFTLVDLRRRPGTGRRDGARGLLRRRCELGVLALLPGGSGTTTSPEDGEESHGMRAIGHWHVQHPCRTASTPAFALALHLDARHLHSLEAV